MPVAYSVAAAITLLSAGVSFGFSVAAVRSATGEARTASLYAFARSTALLVVAVVALFSGSIGFVTAAAVAMIIVQAIDTYVGTTQKNRRVTFGPATIAVLNLAALVWLLLS
jgi:hypothetical protein